MISDEKFSFDSNKYKDYQRLPITEDVIDKLGFTEYWDEHCVWGTRSLRFFDGSFFTITEYLEQDDINEGYRLEKFYEANHYGYWSEMDNMKDTNIYRNLFFIEDLYDVIEAFHPDKISEFLERCKKVNMEYYIQQYLDYRKLKAL